MNFLPKSTWRYAVLIVVLFAIVAVASSFIISFMGDQIPDIRYAPIIRQLSVAIWLLTMGFMFLSGALGLWMIRSAAEIESRRRIGRFVDAMDYLSDGLLVLDREGRVTGSNPAARRLAPRAIPERGDVTLRDIFLCLTERDGAHLLDSRHPREIERHCAYSHGLRTLRFRSQPAEGVILILVSDVTDVRFQEMRQKQLAQVQLVGRIAGGVAHDFNNILCAIAGHATVLPRFEKDTDAFKRSLDIIVDETQRGAKLSRQLLELSRSGGGGEPSARLAQDLQEAATLLRVALSPAWTVKTAITGAYPTVPLTAAQIEQVVLNLGLLAVDAQARPGTIVISLDKPGPGHLLDVGDQFAAVILISAEGSEAARSAPAVVPSPLTSALDDSGVIPSVVRSLVEEARGRMDHLTAAGGLCVYRVCLPHLEVENEEETTTAGAAAEAAGLHAVLAHWRVLLGGPDRAWGEVERRLREWGTQIEKHDTIAALLAGVQSDLPLDAMLIDKGILGAEADGLLKAILKLCPRVGVVVLSEAPDAESPALREAIVFQPHAAEPEQIIRAMIEARARTAARGVAAAQSA